MPRPSLVVGLLLLTACAGRLSTPTTGTSSSAPEDAFACAKKQLAALEYKQNSIDVEEHRTTATKIDLKSRRADTQFRRILDRIEVEVQPGADGATHIDVSPRTFAEYTTQRGPTEVEESPSETVQRDAQQLLERCRS